MADSDTIAQLRRYAGDGPIPLVVNPDELDDDDETFWDELDDLERQMAGEGLDDEPGDDEDDGDEGDDEGDDDEGEDSGEGGEDEDDEGAPDTPASDRLARIASTVIPSHLVERVARAPTPAGLLGVIVGLLLLTAILVPANSSGDTRLVLLWKALTGGVALPPTQRAAAATASADVQAVEQAAASAWSDFWDGTITG